MLYARGDIITVDAAIEHHDGLGTGVARAVDHHNDVVLIMKIEGIFAKWLVRGMTHHRQILQRFEESFRRKERMDETLRKGNERKLPK